MSIPSTSDIASIGEAIAKYPSERIKGVTLASLIRSAARGINIREIVGVPTGPGALTKFACEYLTNFIKPIDRAALSAEESDVVFLKCVATPNIPITSEIRPAFKESCWSVFLRPSSFKRLVLLPDDSTSFNLSIVDPQNIGSLRVIDGITQHEYKAILDNYLRDTSKHEIPEELVPELKGAATYARFIELLKGAGGNQFLNWLAYRREGIRKLFLSRIKDLGLDEVVQQHLLSQLDESQFKAKKIAQEVREIKQVARPDGMACSDEEYQARQMLKLVSDSMSLDEIRALHIPFGRVLDAMKKISKR